MNKKLSITIIFFVSIAFALLFFDRLIIFLDFILNSSLILENYSLKVITFIGIYSLSICFLLPLGLILMPLSGYLFGIVKGFFICNFSISVGLMLILLIVKKNFSDYLNKKIKKNLPKIENLLSKNNLSSLFLIRLIGLLPFSIQNILSAHIAIKTIPYILIPLFVMSPWTLVLNYMGSRLQKYSLNDNIVISDLIENDYFIIFVLLFYLITFLFVMRNIKKKLNKSSSEIKVSNK